MTRKTIALVVLLILLAGCAGRTRRAPVFDARAPQPAAARSPAAPAAPAAAAPRAAHEEYYTVKQGDTLYSIALEHGADYRDLAHWNRLEDPAKIRVGQRLRVSAPVSPAEPGRARIGTLRPASRVEAKPLEQKEAKEEEAKEAKEPRPQAVATLFMWPAKGRVIAGFAQPRSKGIDIEGKPGDPVLAAAAGRVTYEGTGIPGMGKLVVIKHDNGFITVYAHNRAILVKEQQSVARGQRIAEFGKKLHFQIRKGASAVDPLLYLPPS